MVANIWIHLYRLEQTEKLKEKKRQTNKQRRPELPLCRAAQRRLQVWHQQVQVLVSSTVWLRAQEYEVFQPHSGFSMNTSESHLIIWNSLSPHTEPTTLRGKGWEMQKLLSEKHPSNEASLEFCLGSPETRNHTEKSHVILLKLYVGNRWIINRSSETQRAETQRLTLFTITENINQVCFYFPAEAKLNGDRSFICST